MISVLILTKNEARDLPACMDSVSWCDDIHVVDSGSTDGTCDVARSRGAIVIVRAYGEDTRIFGGDEAAHRNWTLRNVAFRHPWVLLLDADERVTSGLHSAVLAAVESPGNEVAFRVQRRDFLNDTWLKHVQASAFYLRLFRPEKLRYERLINTRSVADGSVADIRGYLDHYPFSKGIGHWLERHNAYSSLEARQILDNRARHAEYSVREAIMSGDFHERRYHQKELFYRLPFRPLVKFCLLYLIKRGFLDGRAGFQYAMLQAVYEYMIVLKVREMAGEIHHAG